LLENIAHYANVPRALNTRHIRRNSPCLRLKTYIADDFARIFSYQSPLIIIYTPISIHVRAGASRGNLPLKESHGSRRAHSGKSFLNPIINIKSVSVHVGGESTTCFNETRVILSDFTPCKLYVLKMTYRCFFQSDYRYPVLVINYGKNKAFYVVTSVTFQSSLRVQLSLSYLFML